MAPLSDGNQTEDTDLLRRVAEGSSQALGGLYQSHGRALYSFAYRMTGSEEAANDVVQDCFLSLLHATRFDPRKGSLRAYLFGVARNQIRKRWRKESRLAGSIDDAGLQQALQSPLHNLLESELVAEVRRCVLGLPQAQREALVLFDYFDLSLKEIAAISGSNVAAVKGRIYRARQALRRQLQPYLARESGTPLARKKAK